MSTLQQTITEVLDNLWDHWVAHVTAELKCPHSTTLSTFLNTKTGEVTIENTVGVVAGRDIVALWQTSVDRNWDNEVLEWEESEDPEFWADEDGGTIHYEPGPGLTGYRTIPEFRDNHEAAESLGEFRYEAETRIQEVLDNLEREVPA